MFEIIHGEKHSYWCRSIDLIGDLQFQQHSRSDFSILSVVTRRWNYDTNTLFTLFGRFCGIVTIGFGNIIRSGWIHGHGSFHRQSLQSKQQQLPSILATPPMYHASLSAIIEAKPAPVIGVVRSNMLLYHVYSFHWLVWCWSVVEDGCGTLLFKPFSLDLLKWWIQRIDFEYFPKCYPQSSSIHDLIVITHLCLHFFLLVHYCTATSISWQSFDGRCRVLRPTHSHPQPIWRAVADQRSVYDRRFYESQRYASTAVYYYSAIYGNDDKWRRAGYWWCYDSKGGGECVIISSDQ